MPTTTPVMDPFVAAPPSTPATLPLDEPEEPVRPRRRGRRNWYAIAAALYGPDDTLTQLAGIAIPASAHTPSPGSTPTSRPPRPSRLPRTVLLSKHLHAARRLADHVLTARHRGDIRVAAAHAATTTPTLPRATNSWLEYADQILRVHHYDIDQALAAADWAERQGWLTDRITNTYTLRRWIDRIVTDGDFRAWAAGDRGITFTVAQIAHATERATPLPGTGPSRGSVLPGYRDTPWGPEGVVEL